MKYTKFILFLFFLLMIFTGFSQRWEEYIGESGRKENAKDVIEYYDKGYLLVGGFEYLEDTWGGVCIQDGY